MGMGLNTLHLAHILTHAEIPSSLKMPSWSVKPLMFCFKIKVPSWKESGCPFEWSYGVYVAMTVST